MNKHRSRIANELKQDKPFRSLSLEAAISVFRTADVLRRFFDRVLSGHGITTQQYNVLRILRGAGPEGLPTLDITDRLIERTPGVTRMIDRLVGKKLVLRERCDTDRRIVYCRLTDAGRSLLEALDGPVNRADDQAMASLTAPDLRKLIELLDTVRAAHGSSG